jgi:hypothetical protein
MTRQEAQDVCSRFAEEHPDRETHRWIPRQAADGRWEVAKISLPPRREDELTAETRADERPPTADDPRTMRDIGGPHVGGPGI